MSRGIGLRGRLLAAFAAVAVPPLLLLAAAVNGLIARSFEAAAQQRLHEALEAARREIEAGRNEDRERLALIAGADLPQVAASGSEPHAWATVLASRRGLEALELLDRDGRVLSSHHWPAGTGLPDRDLVLPGDGALRIEKVAAGYGFEERLALVSERTAEWPGHSVLLRGGGFLDGARLDRLSSLLGVELALHESSRGRWFTRSGSPLSAWPGDPVRSADEAAMASVAGARYRLGTAALSPTLRLVAAVPATTLDALTRRIRELTFALAGAALLAALLAAFWWSGRVARPVRALAAGAQRVAAGDLETRVPEAAPAELAALARAFNLMTHELRASRERLVQAERVAAWREMARRLAHELKNPLFPIQISIETLQRAFEAAGTPEGEARFRGLFADSSDTILAELRSLRAIVDEFSAFARLPQPRLRPTDLNGLVERTLDLQQARAGRVSVERILDPELPAAAADEDLLRRALDNLVANALDAMPDGGTLRVETASADGAATISVADTGPGLSEEQRARVFTPYFTTKPGGTGLGLAIVQGIVSDHGGRVRLETALGRGTTFTLELPLAAPAGASRPENARDATKMGA